MRIIADLHIHSHFSRATSKNLNLEYLSKWAQMKGVQVVGTGDIAHPGWLSEMRERLEPAEDGLFRLKDACERSIEHEIPVACRGPVRFMLAGEISNIYRKNDKVRKIHNVVFLPSFDAVEKFQVTLERIGNIRSDGRPILGLDSRDLLEIVLETDPEGYLIPAHIWTPWFALLGSMSGFDSVEECFGDLTEHIFAVETGLSSDPAMNWRLSMLDKYTLVSNSDAHSPQKLAREANVFDSEISYRAMFDALKSGDMERFQGTIEFFPEEGKYHLDGHRKCEIRWDPKETLEHDSICSKCGKQVTVGVSHRVEKLADREPGQMPERRHRYKSLIPLPEVIAEIYGVGVNSKRVNQAYEYLLSKLGNELSILQEIPLEDLRKTGGTPLAEGIRRMRTGELRITAGFDGEYGTVHIFDEEERLAHSQQLGFFIDTIKNEEQDSTRLVDGGAPAEKRSVPPKQVQKKEVISDVKKSYEHGPNAQQIDAIRCTGNHLLIVAGPGTGKTRTLTGRIAHLVHELRVPPERILAVTFTNRAAIEVKERLSSQLGADADGIAVSTFHALGNRILRQDGTRLNIPQDYTIADDRERMEILRKGVPGLKAADYNSGLEHISQAKIRLLSPEEYCAQVAAVDHFGETFSEYNKELRQNRMLDYDDLISCSVQLLETNREAGLAWRERYRWISIDEYQDINYAQYRLVKLLAGPETNVCAIGDPDQSIYGFRGGNRQFFRYFKRAFDNVQTINLRRNYRSSKTIVEAASQVIEQSSDGVRTSIWSDIVAEKKVDIHAASTDKAEAEYVVHQIESMIGGTSYFSIDSGRIFEDEKARSLSFSDFAVLYRIHSQGRLLREAFDRSGIPFQVAGETTLYDLPESKALLDYLHFAGDNSKNIHLARILLRENCGIGEATLADLLRQAKGIGETLWNTLTNTTQIRRTPSLKALIAWLIHLKDAAENQLVVDLVDMVVKRLPEVTERTGTLAPRIRLRASQFDRNLQAFLDSTALANASDEYDPRADWVSLMTLHAAKGLEFDVVFITGCEESLLPYNTRGKNYDIDEERRLFYVGMTRAKQKLLLTRAMKRLLFGEYMNNRESRFVASIKDILKEIKAAEFRKTIESKIPADRQMDLF